MSNVLAGESEWDAVTMDRSTASNIRIACIAIAAYDFVLTLPAEWRIYRGRPGQNFVRASPSFFFLVRYTSAVLLITGSYVFWRGTGFSDVTCHRLSLVPVIFKCLQAMVVQLIMGWRTYTISRQRKFVLYSLTCLYIAVISVQWFTIFYGRMVTRPGGTCSASTQTRVQWVFYLCCVVWDGVTLLVSLFYLSRIRTTSPFMTKLTRTMSVDGLVYFVAMTAVNALNMLIFLNATQPVTQGL
ncbi:hypothetical protein BDM02DRAFT_2018660 [Thelephora ganbajun]|uniref:Uncharacterized protein n=1 Tax=Thelephora ganbajun TaxID=370292 RepID=A0ACB6ZGR1_THEGA|nr:hypothetical protein BDM02DRAFT_2018660 [Thelephora ganbajun]